MSKQGKTRQTWPNSFMITKNLFAQAMDKGASNITEVLWNLFTHSQYKGYNANGVCYCVYYPPTQTYYLGVSTDGECMSLDDLHNKASRPNFTDGSLGSVRGCGISNGAFQSSPPEKEHLICATKDGDKLLVAKGYRDGPYWELADVTTEFEGFIRRTIGKRFEDLNIHCWFPYQPPSLKRSPRGKNIIEIASMVTMSLRSRDLFEKHFASLKFLYACSETINISTQTQPDGSEKLVTSLDQITDPAGGGGSHGGLFHPWCDYTSLFCAKTFEVVNDSVRLRISGQEARIDNILCKVKAKFYMFPGFSPIKSKKRLCNLAQKTISGRKITGGGANAMLGIKPSHTSFLRVPGAVKLCNPKEQKIFMRLGGDAVHITKHIINMCEGLGIAYEPGAHPYSDVASWPEYANLFPEPDNIIRRPFIVMDFSIEKIHEWTYVVGDEVVNFLDDAGLESFCGVIGGSLLENFFLADSQLARDVVKMICKELAPKISEEMKEYCNRMYPMDDSEWFSLEVESGGRQKGPVLVNRMKKPIGDSLKLDSQEFVDLVAPDGTLLNTSEFDIAPGTRGYNFTDIE